MEIVAIGLTGLGLVTLIAVLIYIVISDRKRQKEINKIQKRGLK